jgi:ectoine hydroxylase-related dioxygenase (phytanoyl-CoA dioxygenase family)
MTKLQETSQRNGHLSARFFQDTGYLLVPECLPSDAVAAARSAVSLLLADAVEPVRRNRDGTTVRCSRAYERGGAIQGLFRHPAALQALSVVLGPNVEFVLNRHNHATRRDTHGKARRLHRDVLQWSRPIVTALFYLDDALDVATATQVIPGSHFLPYVGTPNNGGTWMDEHHVFGDLLHQTVPVPARRGDLLLLNGLAFHAMGDGSSASERLLLTGAYRSVDELRRPVTVDEDPEAVLVLGEHLFRGDS